MDRARTREIITRWGTRRDLVIEMLHDIQSEEHYLPKEVLRQISKEVSVPVSHLFGIATFYNAFSLTPRGKHHICVCTGTPCHALGAPRLVAALERHLKVGCGGTTEDRNFTLEVSGCVGTCALAPIVIIDGEFYGLMMPGGIPKLVDKYKEEEEKCHA